MNKNTLRAGFVAVVLAGGLIVTTGSASADSGCGPGVTAKTSQRMVTNPLTGKQEMGTVTECPDVKISAGVTVVSSVTPGVGVDFRDDNGNRTSSGLSSRDQFKYLGLKKVGKGEDGMLVKVEQITQGRGGWGELYIGWVPMKYTARPDLLV
jgi:hypothetical protein